MSVEVWDPRAIPASIEAKGQASPALAGNLLAAYWRRREAARCMSGRGGWKVGCCLTQKKASTEGAEWRDCPAAAVASVMEVETCGRGGVGGGHQSRAIGDREAWTGSFHRGDEAGTQGVTVDKSPDRAGFS